MVDHTYAHGEANFGPPADREIDGGAHLTFDVIMWLNDHIVALRRPDGYHDGPLNALYGPHGLIRFGESVDDCVQRLVDEQAGGVRVLRTDLLSMPTWVDDNNHWHMALNVLASIDDLPSQPLENVSEVVQVPQGHPGSDFAWFDDDQLAQIFARISQIHT